MMRKMLSLAALAAFAGMGSGVAVSVGAPAARAPALRDVGRGSGLATPIRHRRGPGWSAAHVKRLKRKQRNRLRAKGQHRQAVR
jgi:hypothetical protein